MADFQPKEKYVVEHDWGLALHLPSGKQIGAAVGSARTFYEHYPTLKELENSQKK